jgi:phytoene dehydrogenase-like protein
VRVDVVVVGAGHNGLVAAGYLARAGLRTLVLERRAVLGGACVTEEWLKKVEARYAIDRSVADIEDALKSSLGARPAKEPKR